MAVKIGSLIIELAVQHGLLKSGLTEAQREVKKTTREIEQIGQGLVDFGQKMAVAVTLPVAAIAKSAVQGFIEQKKAMADVEAALKSMGNASGKTAAELGKTADQLETRSLYDAEVILKDVTAQLLTFGRISGQEFDRAQQATIDLAARMNGDLKGAAIQIGKALNDPVKGVSALGKAGIQFSDSQKAMIKSLVETGNVAAAQRIVLKELETQFSGAAAVAADATPWRAAQVAIGQAMDAIGEIVLPLVTKMAEAVRRVAEEFSKLSPEMKQTVVAVAGVAAAAGPLLIVMGSLIQSTAGITAAFVTMSGGGVTAVAALRNVALAATGLGAIVVGLGLNFQQTTAFVLGAAGAYATYRTAVLLGTLASKAFSSQMAVQAAAAISSTRVIGGVTAAKVALSGVVGTLTGGLRALTAALVTNPFTAVAVAVGALAGAMVTLTERQRQARQETNNLILSLRALAKAGAAEFTTQRLQLAAKLSSEQRKLQQMRGGQAAGSNLEQALIGRGTKVFATNEELAAQNRVVSNLRLELQLMDENYASATKAAEQMAVPVAQSGVAAEGAGRQVRGLASDANQAADAFRNLYDSLFPYQAAVRKFEKEQADILSSKLSDAEKDEAIARLREKSFRERTQGLGDAKVSDRLTGTGPIVDFKKQFDDLQDVLQAGVAKTRAQTVQIAQSFREMANSVASSLRQLADGIRGGDFFSILEGAVGLFTQLGSAGLFGRGLQTRLNTIPGRANGTAFHPGGLMKVGERGPEILQVPRGGRVIPNHELRQAGSVAGRVHVTVGIDDSGNLRAAVEPMVREYSGVAAQAGAAMAQAQMVQRSRRRYR